MDIKTLQAALNHVPFRPFPLHADGRTVRVRHPKQGFITPDKSTEIVAGREGG